MLLTTVEFITLASQGNAIDYGDLTQTRWRWFCNKSVLKVFWAGGKSNWIINTIDTLIINQWWNSNRFWRFSFS